MNYEIKIALYPFTCPVTGKSVRKGQNYIEQDGIALSIEAGLPKRNLKKIEHHGSNKIYHGRICDNRLYGIRLLLYEISLLFHSVFKEEII